jgi:hypothetical protein
MSAKGADARHHTIKELASPLGGALNTLPVLRVFLKSGLNSRDCRMEASGDANKFRD